MEVTDFQALLNGVKAKVTIDEGKQC